jgi:hypothetical protein
MPKSLSEFEKLEEVEGRAGGKKVEWQEIADKINEAQQAYTVKEVWETFAEKKVTQFRTKNALDKLTEAGKLKRLWDGKRFYYGPSSV